MNQLWSIWQFILYYLRSDTRYDVHSPYLTELIKALFQSDQKPPVFLKEFRRKLSKNPRMITVQNFGAGSRIQKEEIEKVKDISRHSLSSPKEGRFLYRLSRFAEASFQLELGTSLGISSLTLQSARRQSKVVTIEAHPEIARFATTLQDESPLERNPIIINGTFEAVLPTLLQSAKNKIDLVFIDGDHTLQSTVSNVQSILPFMNDEGIIILHDIYWSREMTSAWKHCMKLPGITASVDLFHMGILVLHPQMLSHIDLTIIEYWKKPWKIGVC